MDRVYTENTHLREQQDDAARQAQSDRLASELKRNESLVLKCDHLQHQLDAQQTTFQKELSDLRNTLTRTQDESGWKEDQYQKEIAVRPPILFFILIVSFLF